MADESQFHCPIRDQEQSLAHKQHLSPYAQLDREPELGSFEFD